MSINSTQPILISVAQYLDELKMGKLTVLDIIEKAHHFGVDGIELRREPWPVYESELSAARGRVEELGLLVTYATFSTLFSGDSEAQKLLLHDIDTAHTLGSPLLRVFPGPTPANDDKCGWAGAWEAVERAASLSLVLALENYGKEPGGRLAEVMHILDQIQSPALKTNIDIGNYAVHGEDITAAIRAVGHRAVYAHLKDQTGTPSEPPTYLGGGILPLNKICVELDRLPQQILYCFEFPGAGDPDGHIEKSLAYLRER